ncbi:MAG TPA: carbon-nitrogen hydrolase family protein [Sporichthyaceae bacterium]|nr:carbon-nitrogen hydrolase family protein [Sporichthyaceae bacterium]
MTELTLAAAAENFDRDLESCFGRIEALVQRARQRGVHLLALPEATLGGYLAALDGDQPPPPAFEVDSAPIRRIAALAGDMVVTFGFCEADGVARYNSAAAVWGGGLLGVHRKVHQPLREDATYAAGTGFAAFDTPVGRLGMMICYDKAFPESARTLAVDGAQIIVCMSAWPAAATNPAPRLADDRWKRRFDLFDMARALENQVVWLSANQSGQFGRLRFVGSAKIVDPGGEILADTGVEAGLAVVDLDVEGAVEAARRSMGHLRDRRPDAYRPVMSA